jgi:hypothetical protein
MASSIAASASPGGAEVIISFAYTTPALLAGAKSCTRRDWNPSYAARFSEGSLVDAYDKSPRFGGKKVATIRLTEWPRRESMLWMPDSDYEAEGFQFLYDHVELISPAGYKQFGIFDKDAFNWWKASGVVVYVVRFELVSKE